MTLDSREVMPNNRAQRLLLAAADAELSRVERVAPILAGLTVIKSPF
jgi:hypothetical protein